MGLGILSCPSRLFAQKNSPSLWCKKKVKGRVAPYSVPWETVALAPPQLVCVGSLVAHALTYSQRPKQNCLAALPLAMGQP